MARKLIAFSFYGGKFSHLPFLLPLLPTDARHYCEPFGGSAAVLLNRPPAPLETYNDIDGEIVNFFQVLREQTQELLFQLRLTPYSRLEFERAICEPTEELTPLERARRFYVRARQARSGLAQAASRGRFRNARADSRRGMALTNASWLGKLQSGEYNSLFRYNVDESTVGQAKAVRDFRAVLEEPASLGSWSWNNEPGGARVHSGNSKLWSAEKGKGERQRSPLRESKAARLAEGENNGVSILEQVAARLLRVQLECLPAADVLRRYDTPETLFYVDPPYTWLGSYIENMDAWQSIQLAEQLRGLRGRVAVSGYWSEFHCYLYAGWREARAPWKSKPAGRGVRGQTSDGGRAQEVLWMNYGEDGRRL